MDNSKTAASQLFLVFNNNHICGIAQNVQFDIIHTILKIKK